MKGNVFQCHGETKDKQQFQKTLAVLAIHINKSFKESADVASVCESFTTNVLVRPPTPTDEELKDLGAKLEWENDMTYFSKRKTIMANNLRGIHGIVWGQCSLMMRSKVESMDHYREKNLKCDCIWLLKAIQAITHRFEGKREFYMSIHAAYNNYYAYRQGGDRPLHEYLKDYQSLIQVLEHYGAKLGAEGPDIASITSKIKEKEPKLPPEKLHQRALQAAKQRFVAVGFIRHSCRRRYGGLVNELENNFTRGVDQFPDDLTGAHSLLLNYKAPPAPQQRLTSDDQKDEPEASGVTLLQNAPSTPGRDGRKFDEIKYYHRNTMGHYANSCPSGET
jgi:hypothetical protein